MKQGLQYIADHRFHPRALLTFAVISKFTSLLLMFKLMGYIRWDCLSFPCTTSEELARHSNTPSLQQARSSERSGLLQARSISLQYLPRRICLAFPRLTFCEILIPAISLTRSKRISESPPRRTYVFVSVACTLNSSRPRPTTSVASNPSISQTTLPR